MNTKKIIWSAFALFLAAFTASAKEDLSPEGQKSKMQLPDLLESDIEKLEHWMDVMDEQLPPLTAFVLPGGHLNAAHAHVARCICRRAERMAVTLDELEGVEALVLMYLNRLSDYLFVLSRKMSQDKGAAEHTWTPRNLFFVFFRNGLGFLEIKITFAKK